MDISLDNYMSISSEPLESLYLSEQFRGYQNSANNESYGLALMAYHLIFLAFYNQVLFKIKKLLPKEHSLIMVAFDRDRMIKFREAKNPTEYVDNQNRESSMFELLDVFPNADTAIIKCKERVRYRNQNIGHVNYVVIDESIFSKQVAEYNLCVLEITKLYNTELKKVFEEWVNSLNSEDIENLDKDFIETNLIAEYKLSLSDTVFLQVYCATKESEVFKKINEILKENYPLNI